MELEEDPWKYRKDRNAVEDEDDDEEEEVDNELEEQNMGAVAEKYLAKSKWFDRDIFKQGIKPEELEGIAKAKNPLKLTKKGKEVEEEGEEAQKNDKIEEEGEDKEEDFEEADEGEEETQKSKKKKKAEKLKITSSIQGKERRKRIVKADHLADFDDEIEQEKAKERDDGKIEIVPALRYDDYDVDSLAQMRVLAGKMLRKKDREEMIEDSYNRYSRPVDEDAPDWFLDYENKHNYKILPITKEEFQAEKARLLAIKNRPIKKVNFFYLKKNTKIFVIDC